MEQQQLLLLQQPQNKGNKKRNNQSFSPKHFIKSMKIEIVEKNNEKFH